MTLMHLATPEWMDLVLVAPVLLLLVTALILIRRLDGAHRRFDALRRRVEELEEASEAPLEAVRKRRDAELIGVLEGLLEYTESMRPADAGITSQTDGGSP